MRRREFLAVVGGAAMGWPLASIAQQPAIPVVGFINTASSGPFAHLVDAFRKGLGEAGYVEGQNIIVEYRWAEGQYERLPGYAAELINRGVAVLCATGGEPAIFAARAATNSTPIVFATGGDPVEQGHVAKFSTGPAEIQQGQRN